MGCVDGRGDPGFLFLVIAWRDIIPRFIGFGMARNGVFGIVHDLVYLGYHGRVDINGIYAWVSVRTTIFVVLGLSSKLARPSHPINV